MQREGTAEPSFTRSWISKALAEEGEEREKLMHASKIVAGTAFLAGYETVSSSVSSNSSEDSLLAQTFSTLMNFTLSMLLNPSIQQKAQVELDKVIGRSRLPDLEDRDSLPYIEAIVKETLRHQPVLPYGIPHGSIADDEYMGMRIPKGAAVLPNIWYVLLLMEEMDKCSTI